MPKISVIIPVHNVERYLEKCLDSLVNQTLSDIEIICINNNSSDASIQILDEYVKNDARIIVDNESAQGAAFARNKGMEIAEGEYIGFVDADDWIDNNYYEELYNSAQRTNSDVAATSSVLLTNEKGSCLASKPMGLKAPLLTTVGEKARCIIETGATWNKIYKATFLRENNILFPLLNTTGEDNYFNALAIIFANKISVINNVSYYYRQSLSASTKSLKNQKHYQILDVYKQIDDKIHNSHLSEGDKKQWLNVIDIRKERDISLHYNEMDSTFKAEFLSLIKNSFPNFKILLPLTLWKNIILPRVVNKLLCILKLKK